MEELLKNIEAVQVLITLLVGGVSSLVTFYISNRKWGTEKYVVQSEATENIVQAASMLAERSESLMKKNEDLIKMYDEALTRQVQMTEQEKQRADEEEELRRHYEYEIDNLKMQVTMLNDNVVSCSKELLSIVKDLSEGKPVAKSRLDKLERTWILPE